MNTQPPPLAEARWIAIRLTKRTPLYVDGGLTRWRIDSGHGGKNGRYYGCYANNCDDPARGIVIFEGRARGIEGNEYKHMSAQAGTLLAKIFAKLVKDGNAEWVR